MNQEAREELDNNVYEHWLEDRLKGLSLADLRNLSDKIIYRIQGLEEPGGLQLPQEAKEKFGEFADAVKELGDSLPSPEESEIDYFLNFAKHLHYRLEDMGGDRLSVIWSYLEEHSGRGHLSESQLNRMHEIESDMYYTVCEYYDQWTERLPPHYEESDWNYPYNERFSIKDPRVKAYQKHMGF